MSVTRVFVYEFITGGGTWSLELSKPPSGSLLQEGAAMARAVCADFQSLADVEVVTLRDSRLADIEFSAQHVHGIRDANEEQEAIQELAGSADWTLLIAPEFDEILLSRCRIAEAAGAKLLSSGSEMIEVAADKNETAKRLAARGIPVPYATSITHEKSLPSEFPYPAVLKPRFGAGSCGIRHVSSPGVLHTNGSSYRLEQYCPGMACSVAVLCGLTQTLPLPACRQRLSSDGRFKYLGGELPLPSHLSCRASRLALLAIESLPQTVGYVGVDLVLGDDPGGRNDCVIEVNPRLTTSYVGLRAVSHANLASAMLDLAQGREVELSFANKQVEFTSDGRVTV